MAQQGWQSRQLPSAPHASLNVFLRGAATCHALIVFLNGLVMPAKGWQDVLDRLEVSTPGYELQEHAILAYDRYGQGESDPDPCGKHTPDDVVGQLRELLEQVALPAFFPTLSGIDECPIVLVSNSIGGAISRLYAAAYPGANIQAVLFLDCMIASTDFVSIFQPEKEPEEEKENLAHAREMFRKIFHPTVPNAEGFDRSALPSLLPDDDGPMLPSRPYVTVIGHDPAFFAQDSEEKMGIPAAIIDKYLNRRWHEYNEALTKLTCPDRARGPIIASGADHFIQRSRPDVVVEELARLCALLRPPEKRE